MNMSSKREFVPIEEIGLILSESYKNTFDNHFGVERTPADGWIFSRDLPDSTIKKGDHLLAVNQCDVRKEENTASIFDKITPKNINDDIYFLIIRKDYAISKWHLTKKVRNTSLFIVFSVGAIFCDLY